MVRTIVAVLLAVTAAGSAHAADRLIVYPIRAEGSDVEISDTLSDIVAEQITAATDYDVLTYEDIRNVIEYGALKQILGSDDEGGQALMEASRRAEAKLIVKGSLAALGSARVLTLTLISTEDGSALRRIQQTLYGDVAQISASLRTASQALMSDLDEKVASSISETAFERVYLAEKPKTWSLRVLPGFRLPMGGAFSGDGVFHAKVPQGLLQIEAGYLPWQYLEIGFGVSLAYGTERPILQGRLGSVDSSFDPVSGDPRTIASVTVLESRPRFNLWNLRLGPHVLVRPSNGIFLPYAAAGIGLAVEQREIKNVWVSAVIPALGGTACPAYSEYDAELGGCSLSARLRPDDPAAWRVGGAVHIRIGAELLLMEHLALHGAVGYDLQIFDTESKTIAVRSSDTYDGSATIGFTDIYALPAIEHSLFAQLGVLIYL